MTMVLAIVAADDTAAIRAARDKPCAGEGSLGAGATLQTATTQNDIDQIERYIPATCIGSVFLKMTLLYALLRRPIEEISREN
jgi:hypothetical protein